MYIPEKRLIERIEGEFKKRMPFLFGWKAKRHKKIGTLIADLLITARAGNRKYSFCVEVKTAGYPQHVRDGIAMLKKFAKTDHSYYPVIAVPLISERGKRICDEQKIGYVDLAGNAKIAYGNIYIYIEGRGRPKDAFVGEQALFSPKAARITRFLLGRPNKRWTQKEICDNTGLSKGMVSRVVNRMLDMGYVTSKDKKLAPANFDDLLSAWVESVVRRHERKKSFYIWAQNPAKLMTVIAGRLSRDKIKYAFTQEAGASLVAPFATFDIVSLYVDSLDNFPDKALGASEAYKGFNIIVIEAGDEYIFTNTQKRGGMNIVDNLQLYADLKKNPLRGEKQAGHILALIRKGLNEK